MFSRIAACPSCGTRNRIQPSNLADSGRCGSCKATLPPLGEPLEVNEEGFDDIIRSAKAPVLVDFWASWCGPCRMAAPEVQKLAGELAGQAVVLKVNADTAPNLMSRYRIQSIPNFIVFREGKLVMQKSGLASRSEMREWIEAPTARRA